MFRLGPRWREYEGYLKWAGAAGYTILSVDQWLLQPQQGKVLVLRHDVDLQPGAAVAMSGVEQVLGAQGTYYFRWCTLDLAAVQQIRGKGGSIGFHYETLTRYALAHGLRRPAEVTPEVVSRCRETLKEEIARFKELVGEVRSVCGHGHRLNRRLGYVNALLLRGERCQDYGVPFDADAPELRQRVDAFLGDGSPRWKSLPSLLSQGKNILFISHPHCWSSPWGLGLDKARLFLSSPRFHGVLAWHRYGPPTRG